MLETQTFILLNRKNIIIKSLSEAQRKLTERPVYFTLHLFVNFFELFEH